MTRAVAVVLALVAVLAAVAMIATAIGAAGIPPGRLVAAIGFGDGEPAQLARDRLVLWSIRLPRIALTAAVGALLAVAGTLMQGLFRNPLADPALVGVSGGARSRPRPRSWSATGCWRGAD